MTHKCGYVLKSMETIIYAYTPTYNCVFSHEREQVPLQIFVNFIEVTTCHNSSEQGVGINLQQ